MTSSGAMPAQTKHSRDNGIHDLDRAADALRRETSLSHPKLRAAAELMEAKRFGAASKVLRDFLAKRPRDTRALFMAAEAASALDRHGEAHALLTKCVEIDAGFTAARYALVGELIKINMPEAAKAEAEELVKREPRNPLCIALKALALVQVGDHSAAAALLRRLTEEYPTYAEYWNRLGHTLRAMGRLDECIAAFRRYLELEPFSASGWWNLSDLKTFRFSRSDIEQMETLLALPELSPSDRSRLHFALGKAYGELESYEKSFVNYAKGNALTRITTKHDPDALTKHVDACRKVFTAEFFLRLDGSGCAAADPIFIVGMPRAGSTLVEQILASHSLIEGTRELRDLNAIAINLPRMAPHSTRAYPAIVEDIDPTCFKAFGEAYVESTSSHRKLGRPYFIDKMGANFTHLGLIRLILPNAKIVDVRRHPLASGFSQFVQVFSEDTTFFSSLTDIGRHYRDYVRLMAHFDAILPGKVHRIIYENLIARPEYEIRRLLQYLQLPFEQSCLEFHKTERVVQTVSAEQVRRPINRDGLDRWRNYEPWLGPLKSVLGPVLDKYPEVPAFD